MSISSESGKSTEKFPLLLRQGVRLRRLAGTVPPARTQRMQHWQDRLERLFSRQEY